MAYRDIVRSLESKSDRSVFYFDKSGAAREISFQTLYQDAQPIVQALQAGGIGPGDRIALIGENSIEWLKWDIALTLLGCVTVALPDEVIADHGLDLVESLDLSLVAQDPLSPHSDFRDLACHVTMASDDFSFVRREPVSGDDLANSSVCALTFSSGSEGKPKCLMINSKGIEWDIDHYIPLYQPRQDDRLLIFLPITHQQQRLMVYACYKLSVSFVFVNPHQFNDSLTQFQPTLCLAPPLLYDSIYERALSSLDVLSPSKKKLLSIADHVLSSLPQALSTPLKRSVYKPVHQGLGGRMRLMLTGMAPIHVDVLAFFKRVGIPLFEAYGMTETGVIAANLPSASKIGSVGKPVPGCDISIAGDGEVLVKRKHQTTIGQYELNGENNIFDTTQPIPTGDLGQFNEEGFLYLNGRKKDVIITAQGHKIQPEFIETKLQDHPAIVKAVILGDNQKYLGAVLFLRKVLSPDLEENLQKFALDVSQYISAGIPIGALAFSDDPPSLTNGLLTRSLKINRSAIARRFEPQLFGTGSERVAEPTADELSLLNQDVFQAVRRAWEETFEQSDIPLQANFFDLGGDSIMGAKILNRIQTEFDISITLADLVLSPTIYETSLSLTKRLETGHNQAAKRVEMEEGVL